MARRLISALGREKSYRNGEWTPFLGKSVTYRLDKENPVSLLDFEEKTDLWYLEFSFCPLDSHRPLWCCAAGCVFDIDLKGVLQQQVLAATLQRNSKAICRLVKPVIQVIEREFQNKPFCIYASGSKGLHVYVKNPDGILCIDKEPSAFTAPRIKSFLQERFSPEFLELIDQSPYAHNKGIRPLACENPKSKVAPFLLYSSDLEHLENCYEDTWLYWLCCFLSSDLLYPITLNNNPIEPLVLQSDPRRPPTIRPPINTGTTQELCDFFDGPINAYINRMENSGGGYLWNNEKQTGKYLTYSATGVNGTWCPIAQKIHKTKCTHWDASFENGTRIAYCFNAKCSGKHFVLRLKLNDDEIITRPPRDPDSPCDLVRIENATNERYLPTDRLINEIEAQKKLVICAPMGSGKTYSVLKWIENNPVKLEKVLIIGTRIQQIAAWHSKFSVLGFKNYESIQGSLFNESRLLLCLNSLPRLLGTMNQNNNFAPLPKFDALIIDEADSLARWLGGNLLTRSPLIFTILQALVKVCQYVLCMDGIPTRALGEMLKQFSVSQEFKWLSFSSYKFKEWLFVNNTAYFTDSYLKALQSGKRVFFVTNSKRAVFRFFDLAQREGGVDSSRILAIHGDMARSIRDSSGNPDDWTRFDLILANGSLGPGASFDHLHFHQVFCLVDVNQGVIPAEIAQLIERPRHLINNQVIVIVLKKPFRALEEGDSTDMAASSFRDIATYASDVRVWWDPRPREQQNTTELVDDGPPLPIHMQLQHTRDPEVYRRELQQQQLIRSSSNQQRQSCIATVPVFDEDTRTLMSEPIQGEFGLIFEQPPLVKLQAVVKYQQQESVEDSELFLEKLQRICTQNGGGYTTKGPREVIDQTTQKDRVLGGHMGYLKQLGKRNREPVPGEEQQGVIGGDWQKLKSDPIYQQIEAKFSDTVLVGKLKEMLYIPGNNITSRLCRLRKFVQAYNGTDECIQEQIRRDAIKLFQVPANARQGSRLDSTGSYEIRPTSIARVCYGTTITDGELFAFIHVLLALMRHKLGPDGNIEGPPGSVFSTSDFLTAETIDPWWDVLRVCVCIFQKEGYANNYKVKTLLRSKDPPENDRALAHAIVFTHLYSVMEFVGIPFSYTVTRKQLQLPGEDKPKKRQWHLVQLDKSLYEIHLSLIKQDFESIQHRLGHALPLSPSDEQQPPLDLVLNQDCYIDQ